MLPGKSRQCADGSQEEQGTGTLCVGWFWQLRGQWPDAVVVASGSTSFFTFVVLSSAEAVRSYGPDLAAIAATGARALLLTAAGAPGSGADYVLRVFGPNVGIDEDPATGSIHCTLAPYWADRLGKDKLRAEQLSLRGGSMQCAIAGHRVTIAGRARLYLHGAIEI